MQKIKGFDNLEKDPASGAVILTASTKKSDIQLDFLVQKIKQLDAQNKQIIELLNTINSTISQKNVVEHK